LVVFEIIECHDAACCANCVDGVIGCGCEQVIMNRKAEISHTYFPLVESISSILGDFFKRAFESVIVRGRMNGFCLLRISFSGHYVSNPNQST
jgi:hypothetical protein